MQGKKSRAYRPRKSRQRAWAHAVDTDALRNEQQRTLTQAVIPSVMMQVEWCKTEIIRPTRPEQIHRQTSLQAVPALRCSSISAGHRPSRSTEQEQGWNFGEQVRTGEARVLGENHSSSSTIKVLTLKVLRSALCCGWEEERASATAPR